jgi:hypothetical protein
MWVCLVPIESCGIHVPDTLQSAMQINIRI